MTSRWRKPLSSRQLKALSEHRYSVEGSSLLEPPLQIFWTWLVELVPLWMAPNTITITGLAINAITTITLVAHSPEARTVPPPWACLLAALGLFLYQSLDAIDGKQARRTHSSSPLGELFDHGCDSVSTVLVGVGASVSVALGASPPCMFFCCFVGMAMFYCAHWRAYTTGTLHFGRVDVTEVQVAIVVVFLLSALGGEELWSTQIPFTQQSLRLLPVLGMLGGALYALPSYAVAILRHAASGAPAVSGGSVLPPAIPLLGLLLPALLVASVSPGVSAFVSHPCLFVLAFGVVSAKITNQLVVAHMTRSVVPMMDPILLAPLTLLIILPLTSSPTQGVVLAITMAACTLDLSTYCVSVCRQIASHLGIRVFSISSAAGGGGGGGGDGHRHGGADGHRHGDAGGITEDEVGQGDEVEEVEEEEEEEVDTGTLKPLLSRAQ
nr:cholinephosphotransferase 1-like isoform X2 [Petromyzon marinus]XP_032837305.1 cholinephosphotransferase 1-like isoform X2 [Petromyzon marinus]